MSSMRSNARSTPCPARLLGVMRQPFQISGAGPHVEAPALRTLHLDAQFVKPSVQRRVRRFEANGVAVADVSCDLLKRFSHIDDVLRREGLASGQFGKLSETLGVR